MEKLGKHASVWGRGEEGNPTSSINFQFKASGILDEILPPPQVLDLYVWHYRLN